MKKIGTNNIAILIVTKFLLAIIHLYEVVSLLSYKIYSKLKRGEFPKTYSEFIHAFKKTRIVFVVKDSSLRKLRLQKLIELFILNGLAGFRLWKKWDLGRTQGLVQKNFTYKQWLEANYLSKSIVNSMFNSAVSLKLEGDILLSLIVPVYKTSPKFLEECIESVINQIYEKWELIIIDDGSNSLIIKSMLNKYEGVDERIKVTFLNQNKGIVFATNIGIKQARGEYIGFLDHDDILSCDALFLIAKAIIQNPILDYIYTDEDKIDENGNNYDPNFKGGWNELMAKFHNYTHHLSVYSARILSKIGQLDQNTTGAQDFDLLVRAHEFLLKDNVCHIPYICYHWRAHSESTASSGVQKEYVLDAAKTVIKNGLKRDGIDCELVIPEIAKIYGWTIWQPYWKVSGLSALVTILIPTKNKGELLFDCIESIKKTCQSIPKIIIIDDNSNELKTINIFRLLEKDTKLNVEIIKSPYSDKSFNYARLINFGARLIKTPFFLQLNNDIQAVSINWLEQMVGWMQFKQVGVVGAKLMYPNGNIQHAGVVVGPNGGLADHQFHGLSGDLPGYVQLPHVSREVSAVTGACLLTNTELFRSIGGFDEINFAVEFNDVDYCLRVKNLGKKIVYAAGVELIHITSSSRGSSYNPQEHINFLEKYRGYDDIYFSPNIDIDSMQMSVFSNKPIYKNIILKPRLVIFSHALSRTGAPITVLEFAVEMKNRGYDIEFITFENGPLKNQLLDSGIKIHDLNLTKHIYNVECKEILDKIERIFISINLNCDSDIVICNTALAFIGINVAHRYRVKSIWHIHENIDYQNFVSLLGDADLRQLAMETLDIVDIVIFQSEATKYLYRNYFYPEKTLKISGGMPIERIKGYINLNNKSLVREKLGINEDRHVISIIGTTCDRKGQQEFLQALQSVDWKSINQYIGEITVLIVGKVESDYSNSLEQMVANMKYLDIRIVDEVSNIYDYYFVSDTFVCASKEESFPMVVLLAMAFKIPIVSTLVGGIGEMLTDGHDSVLVRGHSSEGIRIALIKSLKSGERYLMAQKAYEKILRFFDNKALYNKHEDVLYYLCQKNDSITEGRAQK